MKKYQIWESKACREPWEFVSEFTNYRVALRNMRLCEQIYGHSLFKIVETED